MSWYNFDEASDSLRLDSYGYSDLREKDAANVGTAGAKFGTAPANFLTTNYLTKTEWGALGGGNWTIGVWIWAVAYTGTQDIVVLGDYAHEGVIFRIQGGKPQVNVWEQETDTLYGFGHSTTPSTAAWHLVVVTMSPYGPYGKARACISLDGGTQQCSTAFAYNVKTVFSNLTVGGYGGGFNGAIDGLLIASRTWSPYDISLYWNGGSGRAFPFY